MNELESYSFNGYFENKYIANNLRKRRKFDSALRYYAIASLHLKYWKMITGRIEIY
jgi:hypothetical protein